MAGYAWRAGAQLIATILSVNTSQFCITARKTAEITTGATVFATETTNNFTITAYPTQHLAKQAENDNVSNSYRGSTAHPVAQTDSKFQTCVRFVFSAEV